ncbi:HNH endonuclease signature motif containing protein [Microbacterium yannicii]|uniref:HNH endonuclease signature motif containing protein n=1 Tax=Microbacterium yannicii TaxID=671622 RepID=UPI0002D60710|nr:HNH endonuclease signature motif containing protein [Microbacterium yannicii]
MAFFSDLQTALDALRAVVGEDVDALEIPAVVQRIADEKVLALIEHASVLVRGGECVRIAGSGAVAARSTRDAGHSGLAQKRGHRSTVSLIQDLTGTTRAEAAKQVRLGEALATGLAPALDGALAGAHEAGDGHAPLVDETDPGARSSAPVEHRPRPWHAVLGDALMTGALTSAQHDAIYRGLGEPPVEHSPSAETSPGDGARDVAETAAQATEMRTAWETAASQLIDEAAQRTVEELASAARTIRDLLDPQGAELRFEQRFDARSFRRWTDRDGIRHGSFTFEDEGGAWIESIIDTALRPRRGGPRFVDPDEKARAEELATDPRTNDQLAYDLMLDVLRAGALADADAVFGTRQAGIRIVATVDTHADALAGRPAVALLEDTDTTVPGWLVAQHTCDTGTITCSVDSHGNPLDLGREARLYSARQRLTLAIRDGGCRWRDCDRPASYCEAHHIDPYSEGGRTDVDRGILLCRWHHMQLHHGGWRITRDGKGDFLLHPPNSGETVTLLPRLARRYAWGDLQPPPRRFRPAA